MYNGSESEKINRILEQYRILKQEKEPYNSVYKVISKYVRLRGFDISLESSPQFNIEDVYDSTAPNSLFTMSAALLGNMWPNGARSFRILKADSLPDSNEILKYFEEISRRVANAMDHPKAKLSIALDECTNDNGAFGTCGIACFPNNSKDNPVQYKVWNVKTMAIDEDVNGVVDTVFNETKITIKQLIDMYGYQNVSENSRKLWDNRRYTDTVNVLHAIYPRTFEEQREGGKTNKGMPYASVHIEMGAKHILRESGFTRMPIVVGRFYRVPGEKYGRSAAMQVLPDIVEINSVRQQETLAIELSLKPPFVVMDDGSLGADEIDFSPWGITVVNMSGRIAGAADPIKPLYTVGELQYTQKHIEQLIANITQGFFIDRLLDLNNETRMTLGEAQIRNRIRGDSLTSIFNRQESEIFTPLIDITISYMLNMKLLGVPKGSEDEYLALANGDKALIVPKEVESLISQGREWYKIQYISPAKRMQQAEELQGIYSTLEIAVSAANIDPTVLDWLNKDVMLRRATELSGGPVELINDANTVMNAKVARAQQAEAKAKAEAERNQSEIVRNYAQAAQMGMPTGG